MGYFYFCLLSGILVQLQVEATTNVALGKPVTMSSQYPGSSPSYAVNNVKTGLWADGCASTQRDTNPWMIVDLLQEYSISSITLYDRLDCNGCPNRLSKVHIELKGSSGVFVEIAQYIPPVTISQTFPFSPPHIGRFVKVWLDKTEFLTVCEIDVQGEEVAVDGGWSDWVETECTRPCGTLGTLSRSRTCTNPAPGPGGADCIGEDTETVPCNRQPCPIDCQDHMSLGSTVSGVYRIYPSQAYDGFDVYCDMTTDGGGWVVVQRREDGSENFFREWIDYQMGFGLITGEHWLGNEKIYDIVSQAAYKLRVDLEDFDGETRYAKYDTFSIEDALGKYKLTVCCYSGDAGDSMGYHHGFEFSTKDQGPAQNCANSYKGGHWYGTCHRANLNGLYLNGPHTSYADGIEWKTWKGYYYSLKRSEMKIRRI